MGCQVTTHAGATATRMRCDVMRYLATDDEENAVLVERGVGVVQHGTLALHGDVEVSRDDLRHLHRHAREHPVVGDG